MTNQKEYKDSEQGRYTAPDGIVWRVMAAWDDGDCWLEYQKSDGSWTIVCETGSLTFALEDGLTPEQAVKVLVDFHLWSLRSKA